MTIESSQAPRTGDVIAGAYVLRERLGRGGMGVVYEAALGTGETVAIKLLLEDHRGDLDVARRIRTEAVAARYISHVNVISVLDFSEPHAPAPYVVMEHIRGTSLGSLIRERGALSLRCAAEIGMQILAGLDAAHAAGVVHADIKSDNILLEAGEIVKIIDFGLAAIRRVDHPAPTPQYDHHGQQLTSGTPEYMAPEVIRGDGPIAVGPLRRRHHPVRDDHGQDAVRGDTMRARRAAAAAHYQATLHRSNVGRDRASLLLQRLPHSRRSS